MPTVRTSAYQECADAIGDAAALRLSYKFRGLRLFILKHYPDEHPMVLAIGRDAADLLSQWGGGSYLVVPETVGLKAETYRLADQGHLTRHEIAAHLHISERKVYRWLEERAKSLQPDLFDA